MKGEYQPTTAEKTKLNKQADASIVLGEPKEKKDTDFPYIIGDSDKEIRNNQLEKVTDNDHTLKTFAMVMAELKTNQSLSTKILGDTDVYTILDGVVLSTIFSSNENERRYYEGQLKIKKMSEEAIKMGLLTSDEYLKELKGFRSLKGTIIDLATISKFNKIFKTPIDKQRQIYSDAILNIQKFGLMLQNPQKNVTSKELKEYKKELEKIFPRPNGKAVFSEQTLKDADLVAAEALVNTILTCKDEELGKTIATLTTKNAGSYSYCEQWYKGNLEKSTSKTVSEKNVSK